MDRRDTLLILFSSNLPYKVLGYLAVLFGITFFSTSLYGLLFLAVPLWLDMQGASLIRLNYNAFREDVLENLEADCLRACGIAQNQKNKAGQTDQPYFPFFEITGGLDHWLLRDLLCEVRYTMMAPKEDFVVLAQRRGRVFPLKSLRPVVYAIEDAGTRDVYYSDITAVELSGRVLTMTTAAGEPVPYAGQGEKAAEAAACLRQRLRDYKSRRQSGALA